MKNKPFKPEANENSLLKTLITLEEEVCELEAKVKTAATWRHALRPLQEATAAKKEEVVKIREQLMNRITQLETEAQKLLAQPEELHKRVLEMCDENELQRQLFAEKKLTEAKQIEAYLSRK
tara:strand:- start:14769 stop:15134 length:366 start_codon:yes stop_codon:yes gene_type:complete